MTDDEDATQRRIGALIRRRREQARISATGFARLAGVNFRTLKSMEAGETRPWDATGSKVEQALNWEPGTLEVLRTNPPELVRAEADPDSLLIQQDASVHVPRATARAESGGDALEQLRAANIAVAAERMARLPAEDIARVQDLIDKLGRARFPDWDDDEGDYALAWNRQAKLAPPTPEQARELIDLLDKDD